MNEYPILFSREMVRSILGGRKMQTRRIVKFKTSLSKDMGQLIEHDAMKCAYPAKNGGWVWWSSDAPGLDEFTKQQYETGAFCPYGRIGDWLWVRETWATIKEYDNLAPSEIPIYTRPPMLYYSAWRGAAKNSSARGRWRSSIHIPRWASRITLEITGIKVERLQNISCEDIIAEGLSTNLREYDAFCDLNAQFIDLWNRINAKRGFGYDTNPWVWAISFKKIEL